MTHEMPTPKPNIPGGQNPIPPKCPFFDIPMSAEPPNIRIMTWRDAKDAKSSDVWNPFKFERRSKMCRFRSVSQWGNPSPLNARF